MSNSLYELHLAALDCASRAGLIVNVAARAVLGDRNVCSEPRSASLRDATRRAAPQAVSSNSEPDSYEPYSGL